MDDVVLTTEQIGEKLNSRDYEDLGDFLQAIDWSRIAPETIIPKTELRRFVRSISDKDVRVAVMEFLSKFAHDYFYDGAKRMEWKMEIEEEAEDEEDLEEYASEAAADIREMKSELNFQIDLVKSKDAPGAIIDRQKKKIDTLEKQVKELQDENKKLKDVVHQYEHPFEHNFFIPEELQEEEFWYIMKYLQSKQIVSPIEAFDGYGLRRVACYQWAEDGRKALFGYFADRVSFELDLYKDKHVQWKIFRPAFINFKKVEKQAKDAVSAYKSWSNPQASLPKDYQIIEDAIKYAEEQIAK